MDLFLDKLFRFVKYRTVFYKVWFDKKFFNKMFYIFFMFFVIIMLLFFCLGCFSDKDQVGDSEGHLFRITLDWEANTHHTGLFVAKEMGFFKDVGLDVEILNSHSGIPAETLVADKKAEIAFSHTESFLFAKNQKLPLISLSAVVQDNLHGLAVKNDVNTLCDLVGKRYGSYGSVLEWYILQNIIMEKCGDADLKKINTDSLDALALLKRNVADIVWVYSGWQGVQSKLKGDDFKVFVMREVDPVFSYYTPILIANDEELKKKPDLYKKFMLAIKKGYEFAISNPEKAADMLIKEHPMLDETLVQHSQQFLKPLYIGQADYWGFQDIKRWEAIISWMQDKKLIDHHIKAKDVFTNYFLIKDE